MKYFLRQAGFEPAHPEITRLKLVAFTARPLTRNENFHIFIIIVLFFRKQKSYIYIILQLLILKNGKNKRMSCVKNNSSVMPVGLSHLNE